MNIYSCNTKMHITKALPSKQKVAYRQIYCNTRKPKEITAFQFTGSFSHLCIRTRTKPMILALQSLSSLSVRKINQHLSITHPAP